MTGTLGLWVYWSHLVRCLTSQARVVGWQFNTRLVELKGTTLSTKHFQLCQKTCTPIVPWNCWNLIRLCMFNTKIRSWQLSQFSFTKLLRLYLVSFPGLPRFRSSVFVQYNSMTIHGSGAKNEEGLGTPITWMTSGGRKVDVWGALPINQLVCNKQ